MLLSHVLRASLGVAALLPLVLTGDAHAQNRTAGTFEAIAATPPTDPDEWKLKLQLGGAWAAGNTATLTTSGSGQFNWRYRNNAITANVAANLGWVFDSPSVQNMAMTMTPPGMPVTGQNTENLLGRFRYDRYFLENNSVFVSALGFRDRFGGIQLRALGQVGYARNFYNAPRVRRFWGEIGADGGYEMLQTANSPVLAGRAFIGYEDAALRALNFNVNVETLVNFLKLNDGMGRPDVRMNLNAGVQSKISDSFSLGVTFAMRYLSIPALPANVNPSNFDSTLQLTIIYQQSQRLSPPPPPPPPPPPCTPAEPAPNAEPAAAASPASAGQPSAAPSASGAPASAAPTTTAPASSTPTPSPSTTPAGAR